MREGISGRDIAVLVRGVAAGVLGSRLLPPELAMARGKMKGEAGDPFERLENDHRLILSTLRSMEEEHGTGRRGGCRSS